MAPRPKKAQRCEEDANPSATTRRSTTTNRLRLGDCINNNNNTNGRPSGARARCITPQRQVLHPVAIRSIKLQQQPLALAVSVDLKTDTNTNTLAVSSPAPLCSSSSSVLDFSSDHPLGTSTSTSSTAHPIGILSSKLSGTYSAALATQRDIGEITRNHCTVKKFGQVGGATYVRNAGKRALRFEEEEEDQEARENNENPNEDNHARTKNSDEHSLDEHSGSDEDGKEDERRGGKLYDDTVDSANSAERRRGGGRGGSGASPDYQNVDRRFKRINPLSRCDLTGGAVVLPTSNLSMVGGSREGSSFSPSHSSPLSSCSPFLMAACGTTGSSRQQEEGDCDNHKSTVLVGTHGAVGGADEEKGEISRRRMLLTEAELRMLPPDRTFYQNQSYYKDIGKAPTKAKPKHPNNDVFCDHHCVKKEGSYCGGGGRCSTTTREDNNDNDRVGELLTKNNNYGDDHRDDGNSDGGGELLMGDASLSLTFRCGSIEVFDHDDKKNRDFQKNEIPRSDGVRRTVRTKDNNKARSSNGGVGDDDDEEDHMRTLIDASQHHRMSNEINTEEEEDEFTTAQKGQPKHGRPQQRLSQNQLGNVISTFTAQPNKNNNNTNMIRNHANSSPGILLGFPPSFSSVSPTTCTTTPFHSHPQSHHSAATNNSTCTAEQRSASSWSPPQHFHLSRSSPPMLNVLNMSSMGGQQQQQRDSSSASPFQRPSSAAYLLPSSSFARGGSLLMLSSSTSSRPCLNENNNNNTQSYRSLGNSPTPMSRSHNTSPIVNTNTAEGGFVTATAKTTPQTASQQQLKQQICLTSGHRPYRELASREGTTSGEEHVMQKSYSYIGASHTTNNLLLKTPPALLVAKKSLSVGLSSCGNSNTNHTVITPATSTTMTNSSAMSTDCFSRKNKSNMKVDMEADDNDDDCGSGEYHQSLSSPSRALSSSSSMLREHSITVSPMVGSVAYGYQRGLLPLSMHNNNISAIRTAQTSVSASSTNRIRVQQSVSRGTPIPSAKSAVGATCSGGGHFSTIPFSSTSSACFGPSRDSVSCSSVCFPPTSSPKPFAEHSSDENATNTKEMTATATTITRDDNNNNNNSTSTTAAKSYVFSPQRLSFTEDLHQQARHRPHYLAASCCDRQNENEDDDDDDEKSIFIVAATSRSQYHFLSPPRDRATEEGGDHAGAGVGSSGEAGAPVVNNNNNSIFSISSAPSREPIRRPIRFCAPPPLPPPTPLSCGYPSSSTKVATTAANSATAPTIIEDSHSHAQSNSSPAPAAAFVRFVTPTSRWPAAEEIEGGERGEGERFGFPFPSPSPSFGVVASAGEFRGGATPPPRGIFVGRQLRADNVDDENDDAN